MLAGEIKYVILVGERESRVVASPSGKRSRETASKTRIDTKNQRVMGVERAQYLVRGASKDRRRQVRTVVFYSIDV